MPRFLSGFLFFISLLAVFKAPAQPLWFVAIGVTEYGHYLAVVSLILALLDWRKARRLTRSSLLGLLATGLYLTPLVRAMDVSRRLPQELALAFGNRLPVENLGASVRSKPLVLVDLFKGVRSPAVLLTRKDYTTINGDMLALDLYQPIHKDKPLPGIVVIHGGSWESGERGDFPDLDRYFAARGYIVASIDYRLAPSAVFPAPINDVFAAIGYLKAHADEIGLDAKHLILLGRSAGGQVALSAAYAEKEPAIKGVIAFYAPSDLLWGYMHRANPFILNSRQVIENYLGGTPAQAAAQYKASSPLFSVNKNTPPTLMIHGGRDELVSPLHDERLSERLQEEKRPYFYLRLPWATHGCDANFSGPSGQLSTYAVERFLAALLVQ